MSIRELGKPLGNALALPKAEAFTRSTIVRVTSGTLVTPPVGAKGMRIAAIGAGGGGEGSTSIIRSGGGGGCAASDIILAQPIVIAIGFRGSSGTFPGNGTNGGTTTVTVGGVTLLQATGGIGGSTVGAAGGTGLIGRYLYTGGFGDAVSSASNRFASGGGGAGPKGNGGNGGRTPPSALPTTPTNGSIDIDGWGVGGGGGGGVAIQGAGGGGGTGAAGGTHVEINHANGGSNWGTMPKFIFPGTAHLVGGLLGGGGGAGRDGSNARFAGNGGGGGVVVEYFFTD